MLSINHKREVHSREIIVLDDKDEFFQSGRYARTSSTDDLGSPLRSGINYTPSVPQNPRGA